MPRTIGAALAFLSCCIASPLAAGPVLESARDATISRLSRRITTHITSRPLREVIPIVEELAGLRLQPLWLDSRHPDGLDPDMMVSVSVSNQDVLAFIEAVLDAADMTGASTWQFSPSGLIQVGPRSRLNAYRRVRIYEVSDLLKPPPDHTRGPTIDLQQALQRSGGTPITGTDLGPDWRERAPSPADRAAELADLIRSMVEPEQWRENGGDAGWIQVYNTTLIVNAPEYMHRAIAGRSYR